jgi:hypothetical protein
MLLGAIVLGVSATAATLTQAVVYHAFTGSGKPAVQVTRTAHGLCNGGAISTGRADAWRCFAGNFIYDPCFSSSKATGIVLCPLIAGKGSVTEIKLKQPLPTGFGNKGKPSTKGLPWAIKTVSGLKCTLITGASNVVNHMRANYFCSHGPTLWGAPSRSHEPWTIRTGQTKPTGTTQIRTAWF